MAFGSSAYSPFISHTAAYICAASQVSHPTPYLVDYMCTCGDTAEALRMALAVS